jgi:hypothetical protein
MTPVSSTRDSNELTEGLERIRRTKVNAKVGKGTMRDVTN